MNWGAFGIMCCNSHEYTGSVMMHSDISPYASAHCLRVGQCLNQ